MSKLWGLALRQPPSWILKLLILFEEYLKLATATRNELGNCFLGKLIKWHFFFQCSRPLLAIRNHADLKPFRNWWSSKVFFFSASVQKCTCFFCTATVHCTYIDCKYNSNIPLLFCLRTQHERETRLNAVGFRMTASGKRSRGEGDGRAVSEREALNSSMTELQLQNNDTEQLQKETAGNIDKWLEWKRLYITFFL